jgi:putative oxidoreductase
MMMKSLAAYSDSAPLILRIGLGLTQLFAHGIPKLLEGPERWEALGRAMGTLGITFAPMFWGFMAGAVETVGGLLLLVGLAVRPTSVALLFVMFVAAAQNVATAGSLAGGRAHPIDAGVGLLALLVLGAGKYSLDRKWGLEAPAAQTKSAAVL